MVEGGDPAAVRPTTSQRTPSMSCALRATMYTCPTRNSSTENGSGMRNSQDRQPASPSPPNHGVRSNGVDEGGDELRNEDVAEGDDDGRDRLGRPMEAAAAPPPPSDGFFILFE